MTVLCKYGGDEDGYSCFSDHHVENNEIKTICFTKTLLRYYQFK